VIDAIVIRERGPTPKIAKRQLNHLTKQMLSETGAYYHAKYMDKHFTAAGAAEYGYAPRKGQKSGISGKAFFRSYTGRKLKQKGHTRPLEWSGASRTLAGIRDVRANSKRARIVQHARGLNRRHPNSAVNMAKEIRTVSAAETRDLIGFAGGRFDHYMKGINQTRTTRIS
jgi:hypothetical protein